MVKLRKQILFFDDRTGIESISIPDGQTIVTAKIIKAEQTFSNPPLYRVEIVLITSERE